MPMLILGKTLCAICGTPIASAAEAFGLPAFIPKGHEFERFSDSAFHRTCFARWDDHARLEKLFDYYNQVWNSRPEGLTFEEMEAWGAKAFTHVFEEGMIKDRGEEKDETGCASTESEDCSE